MLSAEVRPYLTRQGGRVLASLVFLYFLNAFIQTGYITLLETVIGTLWLLFCYLLSRKLGILTVLALSFAGMILWGIYLKSAPVSDFLTYYIHTTRLSSGEFSALFETKSPSAVAYYSTFHWLLGPAYVSHYIASAAAWTGGAALGYKALRPFVDDERKAMFVCFGLMLCPTFLVSSPLISSEAVHFLLLALCAWLISRHLTDAGPFPYLYAALGLGTAALFLTRSTGGLALVVCLIVICVGKVAFPRKIDRSPTEPDSRRSRHPLILSAIVLIFFVSVWFAHAQLSQLSGQGFEVTPSPWGAFSLLFGTNFDSKGRFNRADLEIVGYHGNGAPPSAEESSRAIEIAIDRIASDPVRFLRFALIDKVGQLWGREYPLYYWTVERTERSEELNTRVRPVVFAALDGVYRLSLLLFLVLLIREIYRPSPALALGAIPLLFSLPYLLFEAQPRYHLTMTPFIIVATMLLTLDLHSRRDEYYSLVRSKLQGWIRRR